MLEQPSGCKPLMAIIEGMNRKAQAKLNPFQNNFIVFEEMNRGARARSNPSQDSCILHTNVDCLVQVM
ncbi:hypothetical protein DXG01_012284 [Tephrocybe rancida]|nr:hypothetical protein DXG01_012284 [Tephrocybe rancida]